MISYLININSIENSRCEFCTHFHFAFVSVKRAHLAVGNPSRESEEKNRCPFRIEFTPTSSRRHRRRRRCVRCSVSRSSRGPPAVLPGNTIFWSSPQTADCASYGNGENHPTRRVYRPRTVGAAQRRDASQPEVHCAPPFGASPGRAEPSRTSRAKAEEKERESCVFGGKKLGVVLTDVFPFG